MEDRRYKELQESLKMGIEVEFEYNHKEYSITNTSAGFWQLCCDTDHTIIEIICNFGEEEFLISRIGEICLDGVKISKIFNDLLYDPDSLCMC